jgi:hypothetical protein
VALVVGREQEREVERAERLHGADRHPAGVQAGELLQLGPRRLDLAEHPPRPLGEQLPRLGDARARRRG